MSSRVLVESTISEKITIKNDQVEQTVLPMAGINYFNCTNNTFSFEDCDPDLKIEEMYNNENLFVFAKDVNKNRNFKTEIIFNNKTVNKLIILQNQEEKKQNSYYNEMSLSIRSVNNDKINAFSSFGLTNKSIDLKQMYELYYNLISRICDIGHYTEIIDGTYEVILSPEVAGVFIHEIVGHMCEYDNKTSIFQSLNYSTHKDFTVVDDPTCANMWGSYQFDDEGIEGEKTILFNKGIFQNFLHSISSASSESMKSNGHARLLNYKYKPIIRMSNTYLLPGSSCVEEMIASVSFGILAQTSSGGFLKHNIFKINVLQGVTIENGKLTKKVGPFSIFGKIDDVLKEICGVGNNMCTFSGQGCYKYDQGPLPVSFGSPHIHIKRVLLTK